MSTREIFHLSTNEPFTAACGAKTEVRRNGHALTSQTNLLTCAACKRIVAERSEPKRIYRRQKPGVTWK